MNDERGHLHLVFLFLLLIPPVVVNGPVVEWFVAMIVGGYSPGRAHAYAFNSESTSWAAALVVLRLIPYAGLGALIWVLSRKEPGYMFPVFLGGVSATLIMYVSFMWSMYVPLYTDGPMSSTWAIGFLATPFCTVPAAAVGAGIGAGIYKLMHKEPGPLPPPPWKPPQGPSR